MVARFGLSASNHTRSGFGLGLGAVSNFYLPSTGGGGGGGEWVSILNDTSLYTELGLGSHPENPSIPLVVPNAYNQSAVLWKRFPQPFQFSEMEISMQSLHYSSHAYDYIGFSANIGGDGWAIPSMTWGVQGGSINTSNYQNIPFSFPAYSMVTIKMTYKNGKIQYYKDNELLHEETNPNIGFFVGTFYRTNFESFTGTLTYGVK